MARDVDALLEAFHARTPIRAGSLIITIFGDAVQPRGGRLSLASLTEILQAFRIGDGLVRTALSRLVADGWLERWKVGRNSFYALTAERAREFDSATERIYREPAPVWSGAFDMLLLDASSDKAAQRAALVAAGYGAVTPDLLIAAAPQAELVPAIVRLAASPVDADAARALAARAWPIAQLEARYRAFLDQFADVRAAATPRDALVVRLLLVHEFRRIDLRDPHLPAALLPDPWVGTAARALSGRLYGALATPSEAWLDANARDDRGALPPPQEAIAARFRAIAL